ncbi:hypothetical protein VTN77DRAFT_1667 [Rasamsonia byssochlamydoides]|uniref:uncharacterized protein n=1 Tax=Rasamsonia byssochlamydoides TaxID=89139 RepID=UPI003743A8FD
MHSTLITAVALLAAVSGAAAQNTCGVAPAGTTNAAVLQQPANIQTAEACQAACEANPSCKSFLFGIVDNAIECKLFSVQASAIPKQESANLLAYDKACTSVPNVKPTAENPTGKEPAKQAQNNPKLVRRNTCGGTPAGNTNVKPLVTPANVETQQACLAKCKAESSCKSFEFGTVNGKNVCRLFSVPAAQAPAPQKGESLNAFDVGCSL